jgi:hypothetical protein
MSNLVVSNISDGTTSVGTGYVVNGSAKAWVHFKGDGTVSIYESLNTSSITDVGTGTYWQNFTSNMNTTNYNVIASRQWRGIANSDNWETGRVYFLTNDTANTTTVDTAHVYTIILGDLA